jgi:N-acetylglucosaminyldiphosphoundecaprenol N-acetyl-beta-D-mannosaminyltransferase
LDDFPSWESIRSAFESLLDDERTHSVFTPNPEILVYARKNGDYAALLNQADLALPDGFGIVLVRFLGRRGSVRKWAGIDVADLLIRLAAERHDRVMFLGGHGRIAEEAAARWRARIPGLDVVTAANDVQFGDDGMAADPGDERELGELIGQAGPAVVLVAFGHPKQERWIARHREAVPSARIMMGVGGALDMWGGRFARAPGWLRATGLEWLWRLGQEPTRLPRILRATIEFPVRAVFDRPE